MTYYSTTRVPVDDQYAALLGKAVYVFAYYEMAIIWIMEFLESGFVHEYLRGNPMTSGGVEQRFLKLINKPATAFSKVSKQELLDCHHTFKALIVQRNALIHAHPATDLDGAQILTYQTKTTRQLPDMKWPVAEVENIIAKFDSAACAAVDVLEKLRK